ncbi:hypothetical protein F5B20DRAFT_296222 [Whalleya microplaca]|nr:hypothetical protein F5B20DRAFT_296222 [Whalleya microplaca]
MSIKDTTPPELYSDDPEFCRCPYHCPDLYEPVEQSPPWAALTPEEAARRRRAGEFLTSQRGRNMPPITTITTPPPPKRKEDLVLRPWAQAIVDWFFALAIVRFLGYLRAKLGYLRERIPVWAWDFACAVADARRYVEREEAFLARVAIFAPLWCFVFYTVGNCIVEVLIADIFMVCRMIAA